MWTLYLRDRVVYLQILCITPFYESLFILFSGVAGTSLDEPSLSCIEFSKNHNNLSEGGKSSELDSSPTFPPEQSSVGYGEKPKINNEFIE